MSIQYYNKNSKDFFDRTINIDMTSIYEKFLKYVPAGSTILDAGCGAGRDARYFKRLGYQVTAFDASIEMTRLAAEIINQPVLQMKFQEMAFNNEFDAIWANASLLHVPYEELWDVMMRLHLALKPNGILYIHFKYGQSKRIIGDRTFYDLDKTSVLPYIERLYTPLEIWTTGDLRYKDGKPFPDIWLHATCRKAIYNK